MLECFGDVLFLHVGKYIYYIKYSAYCYLCQSYDHILK